MDQYNDIDDNSSLIEIDESLLNELADINDNIGIDMNDSDGEFDEYIGEDDGFEIQDNDNENDVKAQRYYALDNKITNTNNKTDFFAKDYLKIIDVLSKNGIKITLSYQTNDLINETIAKYKVKNEVDRKIITASVIYNNISTSLDILDYVNLLINKKYFTKEGYNISMLMNNTSGSLKTKYINVITKLQLNKEDDIMTDRYNPVDVQIFPRIKLHFKNIKVPRYLPEDENMSDSNMSDSDTSEYKSLIDYNIIKEIVKLFNTHTSTISIDGLDNSEGSLFLYNLKKEYEQQLAIYELINTNTSFIKLIDSKYLIDGYYEMYLNIIKTLQKEIALIQPKTVLSYKKILEENGFETEGQNIKQFLNKLTEITVKILNKEYKNTVSELQSEFKLLKYKYLYKIDKLHNSTIIDEVEFAAFVSFNGPEVFKSIVDFYKYIKVKQEAFRKELKRERQLIEKTEKLDLNEKSIPSRKKKYDDIREDNPIFRKKSSFLIK
jgi:hypothetical protein